MTDPQWEDDFAIVDKEELEKKATLKDILISTGLVDYENLSKEEREMYDELDNHYLDEDEEK